MSIQYLVTQLLPVVGSSPLLAGLNLNVIRPANTTPNDKLPVLFVSVLSPDIGLQGTPDDGRSGSMEAAL